ncbi:MAG: DUF3524 domain-containing protein [Planctomycetota bacterium]
MRILVLNPYHAGSHAAFVEGWVKHSRHTFEVLTLPGHHWKWRMRHAGATFAEQLQAKPQAAGEQEFDAIWCTSMLDLASFYGLCDAPFRGLPAMVYFHENQLTYPSRAEDAGGRDQHFAITHLTSALAAIQRAPGSSKAIGWNSAFHRDSFLNAARKLLKQMPGREMDHVPGLIAGASAVLSPGVDLGGGGRPTGTEVPEPRPWGQGDTEALHILWVGRWEHDKDPDAFFAALKKLKKRGVRFKLSVLGESFEQVPDCFATAKKRFADEIVRWGFQETRAEYEAALREADVVVSTGRHEFFGIAVVEAVMAGCFPVLPHRLAYPEVFGEDERFYYDGTPDGLAGRLMELCGKGNGLPEFDAAVVEKYRWEHATGRLDETMEAMG